MARHNYHTLAASLHVEDTPVWLNPAFGPAVELRVAYNQADSSQAQLPTTTSFGGRWTFNWQSYLRVHGDNLVTHHMGGGGVAVHQRDGGVWKDEHRGDGTFDTALAATAWPDVVELRQPDGGRERYTRLAGTATQTWYLTHRRDAQGNEVEVQYDSDRRITQIVDASGGTLHFHYQSDDYAYAQSFYLVWRVYVSDGRYASFSYTDRGGATGLVLSRITDMGGIESEFEYGYSDRGVWTPGGGSVVWQSGLGWVGRSGDPVRYPDPDFLRLLRTPYGETVFTTGWGPILSSGPAPSGTDADQRPYIQRWVEAALPTGEHERIEFRDVRATALDCGGLAPCGYAAGAEVLPASVAAASTWAQPDSTVDSLQWRDLRNTYFWNATGYARGQQAALFDPRHAHVYHWLHTGDGGESTAGVLESEVPPGESRVYYLYEGQTNSLYLPRSGALRLPVRRVLSARLTTPTGPGSAELSSRTSHVAPVPMVTAGGQVRETLDPAGRPRCLTWSNDGLDLLSVHARQCAGPNAPGDATLSADRLVRVEYSLAGHLPVRVTDPAGQATEYLYNVRGQVLQVTRPDGKKVGYVYGAASTAHAGAPALMPPLAGLHPALAATEGRLLRVLSPLVDAAPRLPVAVVSTAYYPSGMVQSVEEGNIVPNADGSLPAATPTGLRRDYTYDALERVLSVSAPGSRTQTFDYGIRNAEGALTGAPGLEATRVYQPNGDTLTLSYDAAHRLIRSANGPDDVVRYRYNVWSSSGFNLVQMLRGAANDDVLAVRGLLTPGEATPATIGAADSRFQQATAVNLRQGAASGVLDSWTRDVVGRVVGRSDGTNQWRMEYRANGQLDRVCEGATCSMTTPGTQFTYEGQEPGAAPYHPFQRVHSINRVNVPSIDLHGRDFAYKALGVNGALSVAVTYEVRQDPYLSTGTFYDYDVMGRVAQVYNTYQGEYFLGYDANDRLASIRSAGSSTPDLLQNVYPSGQAADRPTAAQMPLYGCQANFAYHGAEHDFRPMQRQLVNAATNAVLSTFNVQFDARDRIRYETNNATQRTYTYDANGRAMWMDDNTGPNWLNRDSYYDAAGNSTGQSYFGPSGTTFWESMTFDAVDRFISRTRSIALSGGITHDARGRVTKDGDYTYQWNPEDRMTRVTRVSDGVAWEFRYDATGRLKRFQEGGQWHRLTWEDGRLLAEHVGAENAETTLLRTYNVDGYTQGGVRYLYERDVRGSVRALVATGSVKRAWTYEPWGQRVDAGGENLALESRLGFAGYVYHPETGLYFTPARVYRPELRRWLSRDPLGERATVDGNNLYSYTANDPVNRVDPTGLDPSWLAHFWEVAWGNLVPILNPNIWGSMIGLASPHTYSDGPIQYHDNNPITGPFTPAITLGEHVCLRGRATQTVREHEGAHEVQFRYMGSFYLPIHGLAMLTSASLSSHYGHPHSDRWHEFNVFEWGPMHADWGRAAVPFGGRPW